VKAVQVVALYVFIGVCAGLGMRAVEWLIPQPEARVIVCMADDTTDKAICMPLREFARSPAQAADEE